MTDPTAIHLITDPLVQRFKGTAAAQFGGVEFDVPFISHLEGNLYQGGCANGLVLPQHIEHIVSLYPWEQYTISHQPKSYSLHWLQDALADPPRIVHDIASWVDACLAYGPTLVHCQAGLNRSSLISALVLIRRGRTPAEAIAFLRERRSPAVLCNPAFVEYLNRLAL